MGVDVAMWVETLLKHPLKYKFEGIDKCWTSVGMAVVHDARFMDDYMYKEWKSQNDCLEKAIAQHKDLDEMLSRYCEFLETRVSHKEWQHEGLPSDTKWDKATDEELMKVIEAVGNDDRQDEYIRDWVIGDTDQYWDMLQDESQAPYLLKEHPPEAVWSHASEEAVSFDEVWFLCPSCHREPQVWGARSHSMYCGLCGGESCLGPEETMLDFFKSLNIEVWPFDRAVRRRWRSHFKGYGKVPLMSRREWYAEKLKTWSPRAPRPA